MEDFLTWLACFAISVWILNYKSCSHRNRIEDDED
jgi:hypothetical protein